LPINWPARLKAALAGRSLVSLFGRFSRWPRKLCLQEYVSGRPANRAVVCWKGEVLAGISVEALQTSYEFGPASVVRIIDHPEMQTATQTLIKHLGLSGYVGFDFVLDDEDKAWLLEMNARVTPIAHFNIKQGGLSAALAMQLLGTKPAPVGRVIRDRTVAMFPQEIARSSSSEYLAVAHHDVPWEEPRFVKECLSRALQGGLLNTIWRNQSKTRDLRIKERMRANSRHSNRTSSVSPSSIPSENGKDV
jgi:hypothetical protein